MVKQKSQSKKPKKGGLDFKKIKRKIGRKLPPPKNATNTEIKSKAIVLPEQSIASDKADLAVSKKGLTLKELLQQTGHHNAKVRKEALLGVKDILLKHPVELKLHKLAVVERLRERIGDDDKLVRETLYQLFKSVIFPGCAKDNHGPLVSVLMAYIFSAMTHLAFDVRLMAFKYFDLVVQFFPSAFSLYAEKILHKYEQMLQRNQFLDDKSKLKGILSGLIHCLSLLPCNESEDHSKNETPIHDILHAFQLETPSEPEGLTDIAMKLKDLLSILVTCFQDFMPLLHNCLHLDLQSYDCMLFILQSIDLIVAFLVGGISKTFQDPQSLSHCQMLDKDTYNQFISPTTLKKLWDVFPLNLAQHLSEKDNDRIFMLNTVITKIYLQLSNLDYSTSGLLDSFLEFIESSLSTKIKSGKVLHEKQLLPIISFIPKLTMRISGDWKAHILQAFTEHFTNCSPESSMKLACLAAIEELLVPERSLLYADDPTLLHYQIEWIKGFPSLLVLVDDKNPSCTKSVLHLLLLVGQTSSANSLFSQEFETLQHSFRDFFCKVIENEICYGPFTRLAGDIQELSVCCLHYFTFMDSLLLQSLVSCCLCHVLEPHLVLRILEVLHSSFRAGHIQLADYASFHITLLSQFRVHTEQVCPDAKQDWNTTFKHITSTVCSCLSEIGDDYSVFKMLEKILVDQICSEIPMENKCAFLRLLITLDSKPTRLSDQSIVSISHVLSQYLVNIVFDIGENGEESTSTSLCAKRRRYYLLPSFYLFHGSKRLLNLVLDEMGSWISEDSSPLHSDHLFSSVDHATLVCAMGSALIHMFEDDKMRQIMLACKMKIKNILHSLLNLLSSERTKLTLEERHRTQGVYDRLRAISNNEMAGHG